MKKIIPVIIISLASQSAFSNENMGDTESTKNPLYYEISDNKYLSESNEFNTSYEDLNYVEVTPYWINQTGLNDIPQPDQNDLKICIIDSGIDSEHSDLSSAGLSGKTKKYGGSWESDGVGHGTHIAGIISAASNGQGIKGAIDNGQANLHIQKIIRTAHGENSTISDNSLIQAIKLCAKNGARIVNLSLSGTQYSEELRDVIDKFTYKNDMIFVAAAGNHGTATGMDQPVYPAAYRNVVGVGAININNELAAFSPSFKGVDVVAPGMDILSTFPENVSKVNSVFFESETGSVFFDFYQIDTGMVKYPERLPIQSSCYHTLSESNVYDQIVNGGLSKSATKELRKSSTQCKNDGGEILVVSYDYISTVANEELANYVTWISSLDFNAEMPTLLIPGLNNDEIELFKQGNVKVESATQSYIALSGTSQAAAVVTAGISKLWANYPNASSQQILNSLKNTTTKLSEHYPVTAVGSGAVNFSSAYSYLTNYDYLHAEPSCPELWYENKDYKKYEKVTFNGDIYISNGRSKGITPSNSNSEELWEIIGQCEEFQQSDWIYEGENFDSGYSLNSEESEEVETITVSYKCNGYSLSCGGGGGFGGFSGLNFGGGYNAGGSEGGGGGSSSTSEKDSEESEKKKQEEYDDIKKRSENTPQQKPGESNEDYNKRLSQYYKTLAEDYKKWDDKYNPGRHDTKIREINNRANKYHTAYLNALRHRQAIDQYRDAGKNKSPICTKTVRGAAKLVQTVGCYLFDEP